MQLRNATGPDLKRPPTGGLSRRRACSSGSASSRLLPGQPQHWRPCLELHSTSARVEPAAQTLPGAEQAHGPSMSVPEARYRVCCPSPSTLPLPPSTLLLDALCLYHTLRTCCPAGHASHDFQARCSRAAGSSSITQQQHFTIPG